MAWGASGAGGAQKVPDGFLAKRYVRRARIRSRSSMNPTLQALLALQNVDRQIFKVERELAALPEELARREATLAARRAQLENLKREVFETRTRIKEIEHLTTGRRQHQRKLEQMSGSGKADAALIASYEHEIRNTKRTIADAENDALRMMMQVDELEKEIATQTQMFSDEERVFGEFRANVESETAAAEKLRGELLAKRAQVSADGIPPAQLEQYRGLIKTREGEALAELSSGICQGCFVNIPKNIVVRLARGAELVTCPSCDRILYSYA
jgi:predicted  nucleic acid-binding Zn-ribbon protein